MYRRLLWKKIEKDFNIAKKNLTCPKNVSHWIRNENIGLYYLLKAYNAAIKTDKKNNLIFARILFLMAKEKNLSDYEKYHEFILPAFNAYKQAMKDNMNPTKEELTCIIEIHDAYKNILDMRDAGEQQAFSIIKGLKEIDGFQFYDAKLGKFEYDNCMAKLEIIFNEITVQLKFEGVIEYRAIKENCEEYIENIACYRGLKFPQYVHFDVDYYSICCERITAKVIE